MASFRDCILSAQQQGVLSDDEAEALISRYEEHRAARGGDPEAAKTGLAAELDEISGRKKKLAALAEQKRDDIKAYLETYKTAGGKSDVFAAAANLLENHGYGAGVSSMANSAKAKFDLAAGDLADMLSTFRRSKVTGRRFNKPMADNVAREILGEATGSPEAQAMGSAVGDVFERLRNEFNAAGGNISKLENYLPQNHDPRAVLNAGRDKWIAYIKPKLDLDKMRDPLTDGPLSPARLDETLKSAWEHITTGGWSDREPSAQPFGKGSLANQRNEHRFLQFKSADDWLSYARDFGRGGPVEAIFQHIKGMTRDIAAMETLGPNPNATIEWLKQVVKSEASKTITGQSSLYNGSSNLAKVQDSISYDAWRLQAIYDNVRGREQASRRIATGFGNLRNVLTSAQLGGASILAAAQDPFIDMAARHLSGLPMSKALLGIAKAYSGGTREAAVRAGLGLEDFAHVMGEEARYAGTLGGAEWSRWLADRTVNLNGLEPITQARKHIFGLDFTAAMADHAHLSWDELGNANRPLQRSMEDYGLRPKDWDKLRQVEPFRPEPDSAGHLRPSDVAQKDRRLAERYLEMILGQTERAVPTGTARSRAFATGAGAPGTLVGEIVQGGLQYKSFTLSFMTLQMQALMQEARGGSAAGVAAAGVALAARGAAYAASLGVVMTMAGALSMQIQNIVAGRDMQAMDATFWVAALQKGGGLGIMGDFLLSDLSRFGNSMIETLAGPTVGFIADVAGKAKNNLIAAPLGAKKPHLARDITDLMGRYTPGLSSLPYTRAAYRRTFLDQLQYLLDPEAHQHYRQQEQQLHRDTGQGYFWRPGESLPDRLPELAQPKRAR